MLKIILLFCAITLTLVLPLNAAQALLLGLIMAIANLVPGQINPGALGKKLLAISIVGLGFGIQAEAAIAVGREYAILVMVMVMLTLLIGWWLTRWLMVEKKTGFLIASGSAICGGSAIAAVAPAIQARSEQIAVAMGCVFILNAAALVAFPWIGQWLSLDPHTFGVWAAVAIHDTSSVVGAAQAYHPDALAPATTLKLARALLIVPLVLLSVWVFAKQAPAARHTLRTIPGFIIWFIAAILVAQLVPQGRPVFEALSGGAGYLIVVSLLLVGASLKPSLLRRAGLKPMLLAMMLWLMIAAGALIYLM